MCACVSDWTNVFNFGISGSVYLYQAKEKSHNDDWRQDGYRWVNQGTTGLPRKNPKVKKSCFYSATPQGHNKDFKRAGYFLATDNSDCKKYVIQYLGDHKIAQEYPHGNSKQGSNSPIWFHTLDFKWISKVNWKWESKLVAKIKFTNILNFKRLSVHFQKCYFGNPKESVFEMKDLQYYNRI